LICVVVFMGCVLRVVFCRLVFGLLALAMFMGRSYTPFP
jgi:hypothetical protein